MRGRPVTSMMTVVLAGLIVACGRSPHPFPGPAATVWPTATPAKTSLTATSTAPIGYYAKPIPQGTWMPRVESRVDTPRPFSTPPVARPTLAQIPTPEPCWISLTPYPGTQELHPCDNTVSGPFAPYPVLAIIVDQAIEIQWPSNDALTFVIYRQQVPDGAWGFQASILNAGEVPFAWRDTTAQSGVTYRYAVWTSDKYGRRSDTMTPSLPIVAP